MQSEDGFINGGFFVLDPAVIDRIEGDETSWESHTLSKLASRVLLLADCDQRVGVWRLDPDKD